MPIKKLTMNHEQLILLMEILQISLPETIQEKILANKPLPKTYEQEASAIYALNLKIRYLYVKHRPRAFRVNVSHDDYDRFPGSLMLALDDEIRLISLMSERYIPVRITQIPKNDEVYYEGVITQQLGDQSIFEVGDRVRFTEDQVSVNDVF